MSHLYYHLRSIVCDRPGVTSEGLYIPTLPASMFIKNIHDVRRPDELNYGLVGATLNYATKCIEVSFVLVKGLVVILCHYRQSATIPSDVKAQFDMNAPKGADQVGTLILGDPTSSNCKLVFNRISAIRDNDGKPMVDSISDVVDRLHHQYLKHQGMTTAMAGYMPLIHLSSSGPCRYAQFATRRQIYLPSNIRVADQIDPCQVDKLKTVGKDASSVRQTSHYSIHASNGSLIIEITYDRMVPKEGCLKGIGMELTPQYFRIRPNSCTFLHGVTIYGLYHVLAEIGKPVQTIEMY